MDLFILGLFTSSENLGIYAQAALMGRFFLLIPVGVRPLLHHHLGAFVTARNAHGFSSNVHRIRAYMYYIHALLALLLTLYYDEITHLIIGLHGEDPLSFKLFTFILPGFLFYAATIVNEVALEASGNSPFLSRFSMVIIGLNLLLNFYLIPFAGVWGAASSTLICLLIYFFTLCAVKITIFSRGSLLEFLTSGALLFLAAKIILWLNPSMFLFIFIVPPSIYIVFYLLNFFDFSDKQVTTKKGLFS